MVSAGGGKEEYSGSRIRGEVSLRYGRKQWAIDIVGVWQGLVREDWEGREEEERGTERTTRHHPGRRSHGTQHDAGYRWPQPGAHRNHNRVSNRKETYLAEAHSM